MGAADVSEGDRHADLVAEEAFVDEGEGVEMDGGVEPPAGRLDGAEGIVNLGAGGEISEFEIGARGLHELIDGRPAAAELSFGEAGDVMGAGRERGAGPGLADHVHGDDEGFANVAALAEIEVGEFDAASVAEVGGGGFQILVGFVVAAEVDAGHGAGEEPSRGIRGRVRDFRRAAGGRHVAGFSLRARRKVRSSVEGQEPRISSREWFNFSHRSRRGMAGSAA